MSEVFLAVKIPLSDVWVDNSVLEKHAVSIFRVERNGVNVTGTLRLNRNEELEVKMTIVVEGELLAMVGS